MDKRSLAVHASRGDVHTGAISGPVYLTATFRHPGMNQSTGYDYSRTKNPSSEQAELVVAQLEQGAQAIGFASGMAAVTAVLHLFSPGDQVLVSDDLYGGTYRSCEQIYRCYGIDFTYVDTADINAVKAAAGSNAKGILLESPTNPMMKVSDIAGIAAWAKQKGILTIVDNTFLTPYFQRPLSLGADIVVHSATKYLSGHNDVLAGFAVAADNAIGDRLRFFQNAEGAVLSPFDSWLVIRGIKTLAVRLERQAENCKRLATWLRDQPWVDRVYYPGFEDHPGHRLLLEQAEGFGAMISFSVKHPDLVEKLLPNLKMISYAESLGGVESLMTFPAKQTHADIPKDIRDKMGVTDCLLRFSVGIEAVEDLIADIAQAMKE